MLAARLRLVLLAYWYIVRGQPGSLVVPGAALVLSVSFATLFYVGFTRRFDMTFVAFLACLRMLRDTGEEVPRPA